MTSPTRLYRTSTDELFRVAHQALAVAAARSGQQALGQNAYWTLSSLRQVADALDAALRSVAAALLTEGQSGAFEVVEGPFTGDAIAATATSDLWLTRARSALAEETIRAINNAHTAASGLIHKR